MRLAVGLLAGAASLFAVGTNVQAGWLFVLAALMLGGLAAGIVLPALALHGIQVERDAPRIAHAGRPARVRLVVRNTSSSARGLFLVRDEFLGAGSGTVARVRPGDEVVLDGPRTGARRGIFTSGPCELVSGAPFGVAEARRRIELPSRTVVYPRTVPVTLPDRAGADTLAGGRPVRAMSGDTSSVREYRAGDPLRHVHWRTSARQGALAVRELEDDASADIVIAGDTRSDGEVLDAIATACCSYALAALDAGVRVRLACGTDDGPRVVEAGSPEAVLEWGAGLVPSSAPFAPVLAAAGAGAGRSVIAVVAGAREAAEGAELRIDVEDDARWFVQS